MRLLISCLLFFLCFTSLLQAQDTLSYDAYKQKILTRDTVQVQTTTAVDSVITPGINKDIPAATTSNLTSGANKLQLSDEPQAAYLDARWRKELARMDLYDSIVSIVQNIDYRKEVLVDLPTDTLKARLERINQKTPFNVSYNPALENVIKRYLKRHKPTLEKLMGTSTFYFPLFEEKLDKYNIPLEIKYLAIVESALRPRAKSRVGATGLWQFMFGTGKMYNLDVNSYVDERMDPVKATEAACQYLSKLHEIFGDWDLALASYNSGPGNVTKAIRRSGGRTNYWNIRQHLPQETAGYVPAFIATMYLFEYANEHGYQPQQPPVKYFASDTIQVKSQIALEHIAQITGESIETLQFLNPSYKLGIIPVVKGKKYSLRLPIESVGKFVQNEEAIYAFAKAELDKREKPLPELIEADAQVRYRVKSGDYLGKIASKYGVRVSQIKRWNSLRSNNLKIGQRLTIYPRKPVTSNERAKKPKKTIAVNGRRTYTVASGDSLWSISQKFPGVTVENLKIWNDISSNNLKPGMRLIVSQ